MICAVRAEWTKFRTVSSTAWLVVAVAVLTAGLSAAVTGTVNTNLCPSPSECLEDTTKLSLSGIWAGQLLVAVLAVLAVTSEYAHRTVGTTLAAVPRRLRIYSAKGIVVLSSVVVAGAAGVGGSLLAGRAILPANGFTEVNGYPPLSVADGPTLRAAAGTVLYLGLIALFSMGVGAVIRDTAVSLTVVLSVLFVVPLLAGFVTDPEWHERLQRFSPATAGQAIQSTIGLEELPIAPWPGLGVLALYAFGVAALGGTLFVRRDA
jgi:ABC-2 type transport system permease protein